MNSFLALSLGLCLSLVLALGLASPALAAEPNAVAAETNNLGDNEYDTYATVLSNSYLYLRSDGCYTRVEELPQDTITVEVYDQDFQLLTADTVPTELSRFGGFFAGRGTTVKCLADAGFFLDAYAHLHA